MCQFLLQSASDITKYVKVYYKVRQVLQSVALLQMCVIEHRFFITKGYTMTVDAEAIKFHNGRMFFILIFILICQYQYQNIL